MSIFVAATPGTRTPVGAMQTTSANALKTSATPTPLIHVIHDHADCIFDRSPIGMRNWYVHV